MGAKSSRFVVQGSCNKHLIATHCMVFDELWLLTAIHGFQAQSSTHYNVSSQFGMNAATHLFIFVLVLQPSFSKNDFLL